MFSFSKDSKAAANQSALQTGVGASFIGIGCSFTGDIDCQSSLRIEGKLRGNITGKGDIEIASTGDIEGQKITANNLVIHGKVKANIHVDGFLRIYKNGYVEGDIHAESLDIESGAHFVGYSHTGKTMANSMASAKNNEKIAALNQKSTTMAMPANAMIGEKLL